MSKSSESSRLWKTALIVAGVGLVVAAGLGWLALRMYQDSIQRRVAASNEANAIYVIEQISAAEHLQLHEHTVRNRLHRAEEHLGRPLSERRTELQVALRLQRLLTGGS